MIKNSNVKNNRAFTLLEIMAAVAIFTVVIMTLTTVFNQGSKTFRQAEAHIEKILAARTVLEMMAREIKGAVVNGYNAGDVGPKIDFVGNSNDVSFVAPIENNGYQYLCDIKYFLAGTVLTRYLDTFGSGAKATAIADFHNNISSWGGGSSHESDLWGNVFSVSFLYWEEGVTTGWYSGANPASNSYTTSAAQPKLPSAVLISLTVTDSKNMFKRETYSTVVMLENTR